MKPRKIDKFTPAPPGMKKVHIDYYMAYPRPAPGKKKAAPTKVKKPRKPRAPAKPRTKRAPAVKRQSASPLYALAQDQLAGGY